MDYFGKVGMLIYYFIFTSLIAFACFAVDKYKARRNQWRIPERNLLLLSIIGGALGSLIGMYMMRHKTQKKKFTVGIPLVLILQIALILYLIGCQW